MIDETKIMQYADGTLPIEEREEVQKDKIWLIYKERLLIGGITINLFYCYICRTKTHRNLYFHRRPSFSRPAGCRPSHQDE